MRRLFFLFFAMGLSAAAQAQFPTEDRPVVIRQAPPDSGYYERQEENPLKTMTFRQRLLVGGGLNGLQFGNPTVVGLSPQVGYQATMNTILGLGVSYTYQSYKFYNSNGGSYRQNFSLASINPFVRQKLSFLPEQLRNVYAQAEVEKFFGLNYETNYPAAFLLGAGINLGGLTITALYNVNYDEFKSPYSSPLVIRVGGFFLGPKF